MGKYFWTPSGRVFIENRRISKLGRILGRCSYIEWRDWESVSMHDYLSVWTLIALGLVKIRTRRRKMRNNTIFTRELMLNNSKSKIIDEIRVEIKKFIQKKTSDVIQKKAMNETGDDFLDRVMG